MLTAMHKVIEQRYFYFFSWSFFFSFDYFCWKNLTKHFSLSTQMRKSGQNATGKYTLFRKHLDKTQWSLIFFTKQEVFINGYCITSINNT